MSTITLKIENKKKLDHFLAFVKDLDFVEVVSKTETGTDKQIEISSAKKDFFALAGMWEDRDISANELRYKAWPKKS